MTRTVTSPDPIEFSGHSPAEVCRRLRHAAVLISAAELPTDQREAMLRRARGSLAGTIAKLDRLIAELSATPSVTMDDQLTERHQPARIEPVP